MKTQAIINVFNNTFFANGSRFMAFVTFLTFVYNGGVLTPEVLYLTLNIFQSMAFPLTSMLPYSISDISDARLSAKRIQEVLDLEEKPTSKDDNSQRPGTLTLNSYSAKWNKV